MLTKLTLAAAALVLAASPALAASYYVAHHPHSQKCSVVQKRPDGKNLILVGSPHKSHKSAMSAMETSVSCHPRAKKGSM
jgi:hypothetical protein